MRNKKITLGLLLLLAFGCWAESCGAENIWDLYLLAKSNDPALGGSEARLDASKANADIVFSGLLPHVDANATMSQISHTLINYGPEELHDSYVSRFYHVAVRFPLVHVPTYYNISAAKAGVKSSEAGVSAGRQELILRLSEAYFALLKAQTNERLVGEEIARLTQVLEQAQAFLAAGTGDVIAVYEAQARLDSVVADRYRYESELRLAEQKLAGIVGASVTDIEECLPPVPAGPEPDALDWWLAAMERQEPLIDQAREGLAQAMAERKAANSEHLPVLQATGGYIVSQGGVFLPEVETRQMLAGATLSIPLFSGGETTGKVRRAAANEAQKRYFLQEIRNRQQEQVKTAFFDLRYNFNMIKALEKRRASAEVQLAAVTKGRDIGTRSAIDLLNAEQAYSVAQRDLRNALYDNVVKGILLKVAAGVASEADLLSLPSSLAAPLD